MKYLENLTEKYIKIEEKLRRSHNDEECDILRSKRTFYKYMITARCDRGLNVQYCPEYTNEELDQISEMSRTLGEAINECSYIEDVLDRMIPTQTSDWMFITYLFQMQRLTHASRSVIQTKLL